MKNNFYIDFAIAGVIKTDQEGKAEAVIKLQELISLLLDDPEINLIRVDTNLDILSEDEILSGYITPPISEDDEEN